MKILPLLLCAVLAGAACSAPGSHRRPVPERTNTLKVLPLKYAGAADVAARLKGMLRDVRIVADERTNSLIVSFEDEAALAQLESCVAQLDVQVAPAKP
jgi:hypothetical protein